MTARKYQRDRKHDSAKIIKSKKWYKSVMGTMKKRFCVPKLKKNETELKYGTVAIDVRLANVYADKQ